MADPVLKAIQGAIISICLSDAATGARLGRLELRPSICLRTALRVDGASLHYSKEHVKSLTMDGLKEALMKAAGQGSRMVGEPCVLLDE